MSLSEGTRPCCRLRNILELSALLKPSEMVSLSFQRRVSCLPRGTLVETRGKVCVHVLQRFFLKAPSCYRKKTFSKWAESICSSSSVINTFLRPHAASSGSFSGLSGNTNRRFLLRLPDQGVIRPGFLPRPPVLQPSHRGLPGSPQASLACPRRLGPLCQPSICPSPLLRCTEHSFIFRGDFCSHLLSAASPERLFQSSSWKSNSY